MNCSPRHSPLDPPRLVSVMLANNETGDPPAARRNRPPLCKTGPAVPVHTDAVQAVGKIPVHFRELGVAAMTVAPHKFGGPRGIGALLVRHDVDLAPMLHGATQQLGLRPGTESVCCSLSVFSLPSKPGMLIAIIAPRNLAALRDRFEAALRAAVSAMRHQRRPQPSACRTLRTSPSSATIVRLCSWPSTWPASAAPPALPAPADRANHRPPCSP